MYGRVVIAAHKDIYDLPNNQGQIIAQQGMLWLKRKAPNAVVVCGANKSDKMIGQVWKALGGHVITDEPAFNRGVSRKDAMRNRDRRVLSHPVDLCMSFEIRGHKGWMALLCEQKHIEMQRFDSTHQIVDASQ